MKKEQKTENQNSQNTRMVSPKSSAAEGLRSLFIDELKDIVYAERALLKALPKMANNCSSIKLKKAIETHVSVTEQQVERLRKVFDILDESDRGKKCDAMEGLIKEGESILEETEPGAVRDAAIISASQKIEHYEIASYGTLVAFAKTLGEEEVASLLEETLNEEKDADVTLTKAAYNDINFDATDQE
ncbi:ferritin-like domain-containing protein [Flavobacterium sp. CBA20B-1]|uniref:YciE/YciF ferroxidase family protein n=1 Tax=unclassified Flavobacterium TaxID=196869 RepID=UPI002224DC3A|nr:MULTISPECIES: ferritin-like domain-containing protein [unclassified Flavobacterium]WCM42358.1 ferritin-like domain-containing protein [Flavobacterium sp. CBA20B-1]